MNYPTIARYAASVADPHGLFRTLGDPVCERDIYGEPLVFAGGNSVVFRVKVEKKHFALKCYTRPKNLARLVYSQVADTDSALLCGGRHLPDEFFVYGPSGNGEWYDVILSEWIEGETLHNAVSKALHDGDRERLAGLAHACDLAFSDLLEQEWAHGDLKPENIFITRDGGVKLIDLDAMYFPIFEGNAAKELGTPSYQHPLRKESYYNRHIDDYPAALISATLHLLALWPELNGTFGDRDKFIFTSGDVFSGSEAYDAAKRLAARSGEGALYTLLLMLAAPTPRIDGLGEILSAFGTGTAPNDYPFSTQGITGRWGYSGSDGRNVVPPIFDTALEFSEGVAAVNIGGFNHFANPDGRCTINCSEYDAVKPFRHGMAAVRRGGLWGFIDRDGNEVVNPQYPKPPRSQRG